ncbi:MAG TPA: type VI secretion system baseplate subunit TssK [Thermoanaerobaculia bacterium]|jgi:type VI secretion system protein ImpJ|nr:type VI secretion system baseplate subunit TssK [Thermoanaerobaculia bacterium]HPA52028.1 type VI secretion system baseplate subunit TssK [Thermoanaerobaculia bacterium]HQN07276.1 type VI secretion system baseplate subunit TssK [Thermoanaerobaculia bacterium]HQP85965.1 type VI secretion system baseplate subunit TssK [Thermoanaerobaculia bacterium]
MKKTPQVLWAEGMFLRPHHLQTAERYREEALQREIQRIQPFYFGLQSLDVAPDQLENFVFEIRDVSLKLKDGTALSSDSTLRISPRSFKNELDKASGRMRVFVGVPVMRETAPNTFAPGEGPAGVDRRYVAENAEALDENTGGNPQPVGVRRCNGKLFFGAESQEGYECLEVAVVERSGSGRNFPVLSREFIPSLTELGASRTIQALCDGVTNRIEAKHRLLLTDVAQGRLAITSDGTSGWQAIIKLQILGSFLFLFQQLTKIPRIHPFHVYTEFARLAGELSIFDDGKVPVRIPVYDHEKLGPCFHETCRVIEALLEKIVASRFVKVDFVLREDLLVADLLEEWLASQTEVFLAIEAEMEEKDLRGRIVTMKLGTVRDIPVLRQRRLFGLDLELLKRTPAGLPQREDYFYFKIEKEGPYWANVVRDRNVALSDALDPKLKFSLYIITKPGS